MHDYVVETEEFQRRWYRVSARTEQEALRKVYDKQGLPVDSTPREIRFAAAELAKDMLMVAKK